MIFSVAIFGIQIIKINMNVDILHHYTGHTVSSDGINPFKPEFTIVIFIHYKPRIAVAILDL